MNVETKPQASMRKVEFTRRRAGRSFVLSFILLPSAFCLPFAGCERNDMHNQPKHEPHEPSAFFADGQSSRPLVTGTVARGQLMSNDMRYFGLPTEGQPPPDEFPFEITRSDLDRGRQRYNIYCSVCHGADGDGNGMIVQRGFTRPPSLHEQRLKDAPVGHFFNVITNGWGAMYSYNDRIFPEDRWRIIAYVRALQLSQSDAVAAVGGVGQPGQPGQPAGNTAPGRADPVQGAVNEVIGGAGDPAVEQQKPNRQQSQPNSDETSQPESPPTGAQPQPGVQQ